MPGVTFLIADTDAIVDGNYLRLANELHRRGQEVNLCFVESLGMANSRIMAQGFRLDEPVSAGDAFPDTKAVRLEDADTVWMMSLGMRHSFLDKMQMLFTLQRRCRIVNSIDAIMHFKSKYFTATQGEVFKHPETWASNHPQELHAVMAEKGGRWVVKPPASSFGRDVYLLTAGDPNAHVILESMCGPDEDRYCLLQRYIDEIEGGEKRVLIAGGKPVGQYLRRATRDHRTNLLQGATFHACDLTDDERAYCERIGARLLEYGARYVGMDLVYPWVIEFNVVNPGGLLTIEQTTREDVTAAIVDNIFAAG